MPVVWTVASFPVASREVCLGLCLFQESSEQKKLVKTSSKFERDKVTRILSRLPDVLRHVLEVEGAAPVSTRVSDIPANVLHPSDPHKVSQKTPDQFHHFAAYSANRQL